MTKINPYDSDTNNKALDNVLKIHGGVNAPEGMWVEWDKPLPEPERLIQELQETNRAYLEIIKQLTNLLDK